MAIMAGVFAFFLFILYDVNTVVWKKKILYSGFAAGCFFLVVSSVSMVLAAWRQIEIWRMGSVSCLMIAMVFFGLLVYTLFFAIPFHDTYQEFEEEPKVCDTGVYGLCRHPGVLWFFFFYLFLGFAFQDARLLNGGILFSFCNLMYVVFQDVWSFPKQFPGYQTYRKEVPFLIPTGKSIRHCMSTMGNTGGMK